MNKEQQDLTWQCLPNDMKAEQRVFYKNAECEFDNGANYLREKLFGKHNLTSDEEPSELLFVERAEVQNLIFSLQYRLEALKSKPIPENVGRKHDFIVSEIGSLSGAISNLKFLFGDKCLPDKEPSVQGEPKFTIGDKVRIKPNAKDFHQGFDNGYAWLPIRDKYVGKVYRIKEIWERTNDYILDLPELIAWAKIDLEPYTEPETKDNMEEKELNRKALYDALCELESASVKVRKNLIGH